MKLYYWFVACVLFTMPGFAQNVAINEDGSLPHPSAILDIKSNNKGILIPRMSTAERLSIQGPKGLLVYDTTTRSFWYSEGLVANAAGDSISFWKNLATGAGWSLGGNFNIYDSVHFLGTINNAPLNIRANGLPSGRIDPILFNTFWGYRSGYFASATHTTGTENTGTGLRSLYSNTTGSINTASGAWSLYFNTSGYGNSATGYYSLFANTTGYNNMANGRSSLTDNTTGNSNTASGTFSMLNNTTGSNNTGIGFHALWRNSTGTYNTAIGNYANVSTDDLTNATAIGHAAVVNASNKVRIGNSSVTVIEGQVPFTVPSDGRFKFMVQEDVKGLDFILQLRPVTYQFDVKRFDDQYSQADARKEDGARSDAMKASYDEATNLRRSGFIAQEVEKAAQSSGYHFSGIIAPKTSTEHYSLSYEAFVVPLVKAVQEQQQVITAQDKKIADLQQQLDDIKQLLRKLK